MKETLLLDGEALLTEVLRVVAEGHVARLTIADAAHKEMISMPVTRTSDGDLLPALLTVISSLGDAHKQCCLIIERTAKTDALPGQSAMDLFRHEAPEVSAAFNGLIQSIINTHGLDAKTKQLIYIAIKASKGDREALKFHVPMAKQSGATREEVVDAILMTLTVSGITGVASCLPEALAYFEKETEQVLTAH